jgi:hypothetical protein
MRTTLLFVSLLLSGLAHADAEDTSIVIKKGDVLSTTTNAIHYELVDGKEDVVSDPDYDRNKARMSWKTECAQWKAQTKELNKDGQLIGLSCGSPHIEKEGNKWVFTSTGTYKVKVKMREKTKQQ